MWAGYDMKKFAGGWILHPNSPAPRQVDAGHSMARCSVSPDGRFVAFGLHTDRIKIYKAASGECVWESPTGKGSYCRFSPDSRWLATDVDGGRLYGVGTWESGPRLGPGTPWDMTSDLAVLGQTNGVPAPGRRLRRARGADLVLRPVSRPAAGAYAAARRASWRHWLPCLMLVKSSLVGKLLGLDAEGALGASVASCSAILSQALVGYRIGSQEVIPSSTIFRSFPAGATGC